MRGPMGPCRVLLIASMFGLFPSLNKCLKKPLTRYIQTRGTRIPPDRFRTPTTLDKETSRQCTVQKGSKIFSILISRLSRPSCRVCSLHAAFRKALEGSVMAAGINRCIVMSGLVIAAGVTGCLSLETGSTTGAGTGGTGGNTSVVIQEWTATEPTTTMGYQLPDWLKIECSTDNRTSQWGPGQIQRPFGPNAARPRNMGNGWGLSVENRRKNRLVESDSWNGASWTMPPPPISSMASMSGQPDPAGGNAATRFQSSGSQRSVQATVPNGYPSAWLKGEGTAPYAYFAVDNGMGAWRYAIVDNADGWQRYEMEVASGAFFLDTAGSQGVPAITTTTIIHAYGAQHETDAGNGAVYYPSSYIPTTTGEANRNADLLFSDWAGTLMPSGYFHVVMKIAPNYASDEAKAGHHDVLFLNAANNVTFEFGPGTLSLESTGNKLSGPTTGKISWEREDELTVEIKATPLGRSLSLSGARSGNFEVSDELNLPWPMDSTLYFLGATAGAQECADLRSVSFYEVK